MKKTTLVKRLQNKLEKLWKEYCHLRDGDGCQVKKHFPQIAISHSTVYQIDHCFSRSIKELFTDVSNGTKVCSTCNSCKGSNRIATSKKDAVTLAIHEIVKKREGVDIYNRMLEIAQRKSAFIDWGNVVWLETQVDILTEMIAELRRGNEKRL